MILFEDILRKGKSAAAVLVSSSLLVCFLEGSRQQGKLRHIDSHDKV